MSLVFNEAEINFHPIFVARQPIFTHEETVWGYELLFRHSDQVNAATVPDQVVATAKVLADGFTMATHNLARDKKILINFPQQLLLDGIPLALPSELCIVEILETVAPVPEVIAACRKLKEAGYILALDDFVGEPGFEPFLELADLVKVDILGRKGPEIIKIAQGLRNYPCRLLAEKVEDRATYQLTRSLGFSYFQGYLFSKPEMVRGRKISSNNAARIPLLRELANEEYTLGKLARIIGQDVSLSYRLLQHINSSFYALPQRIQSIIQATTLMGGRALRHWLMAIVLSDLDQEPRGQELVFTAVCRARFLEQLACRAKAMPYGAATMFLLGLFSNLDAILGLEMAEIMTGMPFSEEIKAALCGSQNDPRQWLALAAAIEIGDWPAVESLLLCHRLSPATVALLHSRAQTWARDLLTTSRS